MSYRKFGLKENMTKKGRSGKNNENIFRNIFDNLFKNLKNIFC